MKYGLRRKARVPGTWRLAIYAQREGLASDRMRARAVCSPSAKLVLCAGRARARRGARWRAPSASVHARTRQNPTTVVVDSSPFLCLENIFILLVTRPSTHDEINQPSPANPKDTRPTAPTASRTV